MDRCPKCGDTESGFSHRRWELFGTRLGTWGEGSDDWDIEGETRYERYVKCNACGHKIPWKTAYGETKEQPPQGGSSE